MSIGNLKTQGDKGSNWTWQNAVLQLLGAIESSISALPGVDYETRTTMYQATANGPGYSIGDIIVRYDIIDVNTGTVATTVWFNQTTQAVIAAPAPGNITPIAAPSSVTVINGPAGAAVNIQDGGNSITVDNLFLDAAISTLLTTAAFQARINTLGQKTMANSTPVVLSSDQSAIPVTVSTSSSTSTNTAVARATTVGGVLILASNASRKGATISNDSGAILYLKFETTGGTSSSSFTVRLTANTYYEVPFGYTGPISGIWASGGAGNALVSELT